MSQKQNINQVIQLTGSLDIVIGCLISETSKTKDSVQVMGAVLAWVIVEHFWVFRLRVFIVVRYNSLLTGLFHSMHKSIIFSVAAIILDSSH